MAVTRYVAEGYVAEGYYETRDDGATVTPLAKPLPVRMRHDSWRNYVLRADPDFNRTSQEVPEYEFTGRTFSGRYASRGPYG